MNKILLQRFLSAIISSYMYIMKCINNALNEYLYYYPLTYLNEYIIIFILGKMKYFTLAFFAEFLEITGLRLNYG